MAGFADAFDMIGGDEAWQDRSLRKVAPQFFSLELVYDFLSISPCVNRFLDRVAF